MSDGKIGRTQGVTGPRVEGEAASPLAALAQRYGAFRDDSAPLIIDGVSYVDTKGPDIAALGQRLRIGSPPIKLQETTTIANELLDELKSRMGAVPYDAITVAGYGAIGRATAQAAKARGLSVTVLPAPGEDPARARADGWAVQGAGKPRGPVVDTTGGLKKLEAMFPDADIVAPSSALASTTIANGLLDELKSRMGAVPYDAVTIAGYGAIGEAAAHAAKARGLSVTVLPAPGEDPARARADGWKIQDAGKPIGPTIDTTGGLKRLEAMFPDADIVAPKDPLSPRTT